MKKKSQRQQIREILEDGIPHSSVELLNRVYKVHGHSGLARVPSRIHELREEGMEIESWRDPVNSTVWHYQLKNAPPPKPVMYVRHPKTGERVTLEEYAAL